jgi:hypothetical protein
MDGTASHEAVTRMYLPHHLEVLERNVGLNMTINSVRVGAIS